MSPWDLSDPANPMPQVWPKCSTCDTPWAWKWVLSLSRGATWVWVRDCKHKSDPVLTTADGPYEPVKADV